MARPPSPVDFAEPLREARVGLVAGRGHYEQVVAAVRRAELSVWIATANLKGLMVEPEGAAPARRGGGRRRWVSVLAVLAGLAEKGVELRLLHAAGPSRAFREAFDEHPALVAGGLELRACPRVHMKAVVVDAAFLYLGSANWTGAGLGGKGAGRRNFELGLVTDDEGLIDQVQRVYDRLWRGAECEACRLRDLCPAPLA